MKSIKLDETQQGIFAYKADTGSVQGSFNIYQAKSGQICMAMGLAQTGFTKQQVDELKICVYDLKDFDINDYRKFYGC